MKIVILGAGQVGTSVAEILSREDNDITLVDRDESALQFLQDRLDIRTVVGDAASPVVLDLAGADDADLMLAVTDHDSVNMVACQVAHTLFQIPTKLARIRSRDFLDHQELFNHKAIPVDVIISPEEIVTTQIQRLIENPGALQVIDFANGRIRMVGLKAYHGGALVGHELRELKDHLPTVQSRVAVIYRGDQTIIPTGKTVVEADDEVFFIATPENIKAVANELRAIEAVGRRVMLAGAGNIGVRVASSLERSGYQVKLVERSAEHARHAEERLENTVVLHGDAADEELMRQENIDSMEMFCGLTNDDEANILSAMLAKRLGARRALAIVNRSAYIDLIESSVLDIALSPRLSTVSTLLSHVRLGDVAAAYPLRRGMAEAMEAIAHGDKKTSKIVGRAVGAIKWPKGVTLVALLRDDLLLELDDDPVVADGDHLVMFVIDKRCIHDIERLFQVSATFF